MARLVVLDFEATCEAGRTPSPQEVIEFPSVLYDTARDEVVDEFNAFVRPAHNPVLSDYCRDLTGIEQDDVDAAESFPVVLRKHMDWLDRHGLDVGGGSGTGSGDSTDFAFVTFGDWDLRKMLPHQVRHCEPPIGWIPHPYRSWINIKKIFAEHHGVDATADVPSMLAAFGRDFIGRHHRGIDDSRNITTIVRELCARGERLEVTGRLNVRQHPPLRVEIRPMGEDGAEPWEVELRRRTVPALLGLVRRRYPGAEAHDLSLADGTRLDPERILDLRGRATVHVDAQPLEPAAPEAD